MGKYGPEFLCDLFSIIKFPQNIWKEDNSIYLKICFVTMTNKVGPTKIHLKFNASSN